MLVRTSWVFAETDTYGFILFLQCQEELASERHTYQVCRYLINEYCKVGLLVTIKRLNAYRFLVANHG